MRLKLSANYLLFNTESTVNTFIIFGRVTTSFSIHNNVFIILFPFLYNNNN